MSTSIVILNRMTAGVGNYHSVFFRLLGVRILTDTYVSYLFKERNNNG